MNTQSKIQNPWPRPQGGTHQGRPKSKIVKLLLIEDDPQYAGFVLKILEKSLNFSFDVSHLEGLSTGLNCLTTGGIDVVLLDLGLPDSDGLDTFRRVVAQAPRVPIVVLTAQDDESLALKALQEGAQDYLIKGHGETHTLVRAIRYAISGTAYRMHWKRLTKISKALWRGWKKPTRRSWNNKNP